MVASITKRFDAAGVGDVDNWALGAGASKQVAVNADDGDTSHIEHVDNKWQDFDIDTTFTPTFAHISAVRVRGTIRFTSTPDGTTAKFRIVVGGSTTEYSLGTITTETFLEYISSSIARPGGGDYTNADLVDTGANRFQFGIFMGSDSATLRCTELFVEVDGIPLNQTIGPEREVASRKLWSNREPEQAIQVVNGWEALEAELMDPIGFSHAQGPTHDGKGWGPKDWERGFGRLRSQVISLSSPRVVSTIVNRRRRQVTLWETMKLTVSGDPDIADGLARLDCAGADREFTRTSKAWVEDLGGVIRRIDEAKEKIEPKGILIEAARTNKVLESSFVSGTTGWTKVENTGTADLSTDTNDLKFESGVSAQSAALTATAATHDVEITDVTASLGASTKHTLSVEGKVSAASGSIAVFIQNDTTGNWLTISNTWQASRPSTPPLGGSPTTIFRGQFPFDTEGTASTHTIVLNVNGTVNGTAYHFYHAQIEAGGWMTSRIVTNDNVVAGAVTRDADSLLIRNDSTLAQRVFPVDRFTVRVLFATLWNSADLAGTGITPIILDLIHSDTNNRILIYHVNSTTLRVNYTHGGTVESASFASPGLVAGTEYEVVIRRTTSSGELGETSNTLSIFLDGVKGGTEDTIPTDLTEAAASFIQLGSSNMATNHLDGWIGEIMASPVVFSDTEIAGGLP